MARIQNYCKDETASTGMSVITVLGGGVMVMMMTTMKKIMVGAEAGKVRGFAVVVAVAGAAVGDKKVVKGEIAVVAVVIMILVVMELRAH